MGVSQSTTRMGVVRTAWLYVGLSWLGACAPTPAPVAVADRPTAERSPTTPSPTAPGVSLPATQELQPPVGRLEVTSYPSRQLQQELPLLVYLPPGMDGTVERLPVVYLLHGRGYDEWQWVDLGATRLATQAIRAGQWPAFAMVMPYLPEPLFSSSDGGPRSLETEFLEGLLPSVESRFRVSDQVGGRALGGISRGGVWALEIAFRHPQEFSSVAALSPTLNLNFARPRYDPLWIAGQPGQLPANIFLATGDREPAIQASVEQLSQTLQQHGVPHAFSVEAGSHTQELWTALLEQALDFLIDGWLRT